MIERSHVCACTSSREPLCPYHAMQDVMTHHPDLKSEAPLFPGPDGDVMSKQDTIAAIREVLERADVTLLRLGTSGTLVHRFHGHCLRISGSQFLATHGVPLHTIMLLGRWSSRAIERYVQEAALTIPARPLAESTRAEHSSHRPKAARKTEVIEIDKPPSAKELTAIQQKIKEMAAQLDKLNLPPPYVRGKKVHLIDPTEHAVPPSNWSTKCGWNYGLSRFQRTAVCGRRCFPQEEDEHDSSSSSECQDGSASSESED
eukprot:Skav208879  [mRNA]  locus=scaffold270:173294:174070:- [translate_table: standard]